PGTTNDLIDQAYCLMETTTTVEPGSNTQSRFFGAVFINQSGYEASSCCTCLDCTTVAGLQDLVRLLDDFCRGILDLASNPFFEFLEPIFGLTLDKGLLVADAFKHGTSKNIEGSPDVV